MFMLKRNLFVFIVLLITVRTTSRSHFFAEFMLCAWNWSIGGFLVGANVFAGMMPAELTMNELPHAEHPVLKCIS